MKICFFTPIFPPKYSGATTQALTLARVLRYRAHEILFVTLTDDKMQNSRIRFDGFDVYCISVKNHAKIIEGSASTFEYMILLFKLTYVLFRLRNGYEIIHSHILAHPFMALSLIGKMLRKKTVAKITMSDEIEFERIGHLLGMLDKYLVTCFDYLVAISSDIKRELEEIGIPDTKVEYLPNGVNTMRYKPLTEQEKYILKEKLSIKNKYVLTYIGGITYRKGINTLVRHWPKIIDNYPESLLVLVGPTGTEDGVMGDDICYDELMKMIDKYQMDKNIITTGPKDRVEEYLQISDLFVFPSTMEGMPNVVLEAMATGVPAISYRVSGINDIIRSGIDGEIIEIGDEKAFNNAILELLADDLKRKRYSQNAFDNVVEHFNMILIANGYEELYNKMVALND